MKTLLTISVAFVLSQKIWAAPAASFAEKPLAPESTLVFSSGDQIYVYGVKADIKIIWGEPSKAGSIQLKSQLTPDSDDWHPMISRDGKIIRIDYRHALASGHWQLNGALQTSVPKAELEIRGPALPLKVYLNEGSVNAKLSHAPVDIVGFSGQVVLEGGEGDTKVQWQQGSVNVSNRKGKLLLDLFRSHLEMKGVSGIQTVRNFSGSTDITGGSGSISYRSFQGRLNANGNQGSFDIGIIEGAANISDFEGLISGTSDKGSLNIRLKTKQSLRLQAGDGETTVRLPTSSGAKMQLETADGRIEVPKGLRVLTEGGLKVVSGKASGADPGSVFIKAKAGDIFIRQ